MRLTKRTNISMRVLMYCAAHEGRLVTKSEIAECCNASENHLAQVINPDSDPPGGVFVGKMKPGAGPWR